MPLSLWQACPKCLHRTAKYCLPFIGLLMDLSGEIITGGTPTLIYRRGTVSKSEMAAS